SLSGAFAMSFFRFSSNETGASTVAYGLAVGLVALIATVALTSAGTKTAGIFNNSTSIIDKSVTLAPGDSDETEIPGEAPVPENTAPIITTIALPDAEEGRAYSFVLGATDPDGDSIT